MSHLVDRLLHEHPLFAGLTSRDLRRLAALTSLHHHDVGDTLIRQGDAADRLIILSSGCTISYDVDLEGVRRVERFAGPGTVFGLDGLDEVQLNRASVECVTAGAAVELAPRRVHLDAVGTSRLNANIGRLLAAELRAARDLRRCVSRGSIERRLAKVVLWLVKVACRKTDDGSAIGFPLKSADLADLIGVNVGSVSRVLAKWGRAGLVRHGRMALTVLALEELEVLAGARLTADLFDSAATRAHSRHPTWTVVRRLGPVEAPPRSARSPSASSGN